MSTWTNVHAPQPQPVKRAAVNETQQLRAHKIATELSAGQQPSRNLIAACLALVEADERPDPETGLSGVRAREHYARTHKPKPPPQPKPETPKPEAATPQPEPELTLF